MLYLIFLEFLYNKCIIKYNYKQFEKIIFYVKMFFYMRTYKKINIFS